MIVGTCAVETLGLRLKEVLGCISDKIATFDSSLIINIFVTTNDSFLLRGSLSIIKSKSGEELAITADVQSNGQRLFIESDICSGDGYIVSSGPCVNIDLSITEAGVDSAITNWLNDFELFITENELTLRAELSKL